MLNKCLIIGRLGKDPEIRYTQGGDMITSFSVATDESWKGKDGQKVQKTEWHNVTTFGKLAEICGNYLTKGKLVYVEGKIQTDTWDDKEGKKHYSTKIIANTMKMLDSKGTGERQETADSTSSYVPPDDGLGDIPDDVPF